MLHTYWTPGPVPGRPAQPGPRHLCALPQRQSCHAWHAQRRAGRPVLHMAAAQQQKQQAELAAPLAVPPNFAFLSPDGRWRVRPVAREDPLELRRVVGLQANAFYDGSPVPFMDGMFKGFFQAEVLSEVQKKVRFNPADRFVLLVAEPMGPSSSSSGSGSSSGGSSGGSSGDGRAAAGSSVIGVVEVSYLDEKEVLRSLAPGAAAFAYIASMAVDAAWQRQGAASALLSAAERVAELWEEPQPVLHVYQDNTPAVQLYRSKGYSVIFQDEAWWARLGARPRYLMQRQQKPAAAGAA